MSTSRRLALVSSLFALLTTSSFTGCQYDAPCGKDDLDHSRGVCSPRTTRPKPPATSDAGASDGGTGGDAGASDPRCAATCDLIGRCVAANSQASGVLKSELEQLGFNGTDPAGCVETCDAKRAGSDDNAVLDCYAAENKTAMCSDGFAGAVPAVNAVNSCCKDATKSQFCVYLCGLLVKNMAAGGLFDSCPAILP